MLNHQQKMKKKEKDIWKKFAKNKITIGVHKRGMTEGKVINTPTLIQFFSHKRKKPIYIQ